MACTQTTQHKPTDLFIMAFLKTILTVVNARSPTTLLCSVFLWPFLAVLIGKAVPLNAITAEAREGAIIRQQGEKFGGANSRQPLKRHLEGLIARILNARDWTRDITLNPEARECTSELRSSWWGFSPLSLSPLFSQILSFSNNIYFYVLLY